MSGQNQLRTQRLLLRPYRDDDIPVLVHLVGAYEVAASTLRIPHPYTETHAREFLDQLRQDEIFTHFGIWLAETGELCGGIGLEVERAHDRAELGCWIGVPYWSRGYCSEAAREIVRYGFDNLGLNRIFAYHFAANLASGRVLQKLGMKHEGRLRQHVKKWDRYLDLEHYGLLVEEWRQANG